MLLTVTAEYGLLKLVVARGRRVLDARMVLVNPLFFREGMVSEPDQVAAIIQNTLREMKVRPRLTLGVVPGYQSALRLVSLPRVRDREAERMVMLEAARSLGASPSTSVIAWHRLPDQVDRSVWVVYTASRRAVLSLQEALSRARLPLQAVEVRPFPLARAVNRSNAVIAWVAPDGSDVVLVRQCVPVAYQSVFWGAEPVDAEVVVNRLTEVVEFTLAHYNQIAQGSPFPAGAPLFVCGSPVLLQPEIPQRIASAVGRPLEGLDPPLSLPSDVSPHDFVVNLGLVLREA